MDESGKSMWNACYHGDFNVIEYFAKRGEHVFFGATGACWGGRLDSLKYLMQVGTLNKEQIDSCALIAASCGYIELTHYLVSLGGDALKDDIAIEQAAMFDDVEMIKYLISIGADPETVMIHARDHESLNIIKHLEQK